MHRGVELVLVFVLAGLWLSLRPEAPLHEDTSRDLAFARDLVDGAVLHQRGAWASFASLNQGTSWIDLLALCQLAGLSIVGIEWVLTVLLAAVVVLAYVGFDRVLPAREHSHARRLAPVVGALVMLAALPVGCEMPILWQPILLPVPIMLAHLCVWRVLQDGEPVDALALAVFCALALDVHVVSVAMVVPALAVVPLASKRPAIVTPAALVLGLATLALSSPVAMTTNLDILIERGWLTPSLLAIGMTLLAGALGRRRFAALGREPRLRAALAVELAILALLVAASRSDDMPAMTGRYLLPFMPAIALAAALATSWARSRGSTLGAVVLASALLLASVPRLRPESQRVLPSNPEWRIAEFEPVAALLVERQLSWTQLVGQLQGPSVTQMLGHLSAIVEPGSPNPPRAGEHLLLVALEPDDAEQVLAELPEDPELVTTVDLQHMRALLLHTPARVDPLGAQLCRDGQDCEDVVLAVTSRVYQAHMNAWIGAEPAHKWLVAEGRDQPRELQWRIPVSAGPATVLTLSSMLSQRCAWYFVAVEGFEPSSQLPTHELELPADAEGSLLVARELDAEGPACTERAVIPPSIIETDPAWRRLRELLAPQW
jgi:hypothetical protein